MGTDAVHPPAPSSTLHAVHKHVSSRCGSVSAAFLACKSGNANPEACVKQGDAVTGCVVALLRDAGAKAGKELDEYSGCLDFYSNKFTKCRAQQATFEAAFPVA